MFTKTMRIDLRIRYSKAPILIIILMIALIGCAPSTLEAPPTPTQTAAIPTATVTLTPTTPPTKTPIPTLTITQTPFIPRATINLVVHVPLSGDQASRGTDLMRAAELAVEQLSGPLMELGYKIELIRYDDEASIEVAKTNAMEIVENPEILCGLGHYDSSVTIQASEIYHRGSLAFISPAGTATTVTDRGYLEVNRLVGREDGQGIAGARFAQEQGFKRIYILVNENRSSRRRVDAFRREANRIGLTMVGMFMTNSSDSEGAIRRVMDASPDLVYFAGRANRANRFLRNALAAGYKGALLSTDVANDPGLLRRADASFVEGGGIYFTDMVAPASYYSDAAQFVQDFNHEYGTFPQLHAAQAYDAAGICMRAIEEASKAKSGEMPTRAEVASAIRAIQDYIGITGIYNFNKRGDPTPAKYFIYKVVTINPDNWDLNEIVATIETEPP